MNHRFLPQERMQQRRMMPPMPMVPATVDAHEFEGATFPPLREEIFVVALLNR